MKPALTQEQKLKFEKEFNELVAKAPEKVQKLWIGQSIVWVLDMPKFPFNVDVKLTGKLANEYFSLKFKLDERTL
jgi:hypothetical protein